MGDLLAENNEFLDINTARCWYDFEPTYERFMKICEYIYTPPRGYIP